MTDLEIVVRVKRYPGVAGAAPHEALRDLRLSARHGEFICVPGPSGRGRTTLLNIIAGLDKDFEGRFGSQGSHRAKLRIGQRAVRAMGR